MTPEQLEEIPGIGEKTLEKISVAVRHYFGQFEEGEAGARAEAGRSEAAAEAAGETLRTRRASSEAHGGSGDAAEAEAENAAEVLEEAESSERQPMRLSEEPDEALASERSRT